MIAVTVFYLDRDGDRDSSTYLCECISSNELEDLWIHFSDGYMVIHKEAYADFIVYPYASGKGKILSPDNPSLMKPIT